ncbi:MAG: DUF1949 domain-containing protein, partial [Clostridia bacterium]|nr:DUF1949 domain-containing protein [Clostridia bacterium]
PTVYRPYRDFIVKVAFREYGKLSSLLALSEVLVMDTQFAEDVSLFLSVPLQQYETFIESVRDATGGKFYAETGNTLFRGEKKE